MENTAQTCQNSSMEKAHSLVHEAAFELESGNIEKTKELLRKLDVLTHDEIAKE